MKVLVFGATKNAPHATNIVLVVKMFIISLVFHVLNNNQFLSNLTLTLSCLLCWLLIFQLIKCFILLAVVTNSTRADKR